MSWLYATAILHEQFHGPLPDPVRTQGKHLVSRPSTPLHCFGPDPNFLQKLDASLESLVSRQTLRTRVYGEDIAEEWPISHTPSELKHKWEDYEALKWIDDIPPTPSDDGSDHLYMAPSRISVNLKAYPPPEHVLPKLTILREGYSFVNNNNKLSSTLQPTSIRRKSFLENSFNIKVMPDIPETIHVASTETKKSSRKRRLSDIENSTSTEEELRRSKRRIAVPRLCRLTSLNLMSVG